MFSILGGCFLLLSTYYVILLSAKPKLPYHNPSNVSGWATVIVWISPLYCISVFPGSVSEASASMKEPLVAAEVSCTSRGTPSYADMTVCTLIPSVKRLYVPFTAMITAHRYLFFVVKTKITIWTESTNGVSPFL